jgi:hypothetical protein
MWIKQLWNMLMRTEKRIEEWERGIKHFEELLIRINIKEEHLKASFYQEDFHDLSEVNNYRSA